MLRKLLISVFILTYFSGCALVQERNQESIKISFTEPNRISFQGKGAGAGMALMGAMGPMGIALGVAIDEGIAKDLRESAFKGGFDIHQSVSDAITEVSQGNWIASFDPNVVTDLELRIKKYGFKTTGGEDDATSADVVIEFVQSGDVIREIHYPNDFEEKNDLVNTYPLDVLKSDGEKASTLITEALNIMLDDFYNSNVSAL